MLLALMMHKYITLRAWFEKGVGWSGAMEMERQWERKFVRGSGGERRYLVLTAES